MCLFFCLFFTLVQIKSWGKDVLLLPYSETMKKDLCSQGADEPIC